VTRYLLDTTTLIDFSKGREPVRSRVLALIDAGEDVGVCAVNVAEFYSGLPADARPVWDEFFAALVYWDISRSAAAHAGQDRYDLARQGRPLSTADALIAAVAREQAATLVTDNVKDYPVDGLSIISLR
jgi:predicted nucleic acid-binding protein